MGCLTFPGALLLLFMVRSISASWGGLSLSGEEESGGGLADEERGGEPQPHRCRSGDLHSEDGYLYGFSQRLDMSDGLYMLLI